MQVISIKSDKARSEKVRSIIRSAGNSFGSVYFTKRSDGKKRRMSYRLRVSKPTYAPKPSGKMKDKWQKKIEDNVITVFDCNKVLYNKKGLMSGRGAWRSIPLENVERICVNGQIYKITK